MEIYIPLLITLLGLSAFFSGAETAFLSVPRVRLEHRAREGDAPSGRVLRLLASPARLLSAILLGSNLVNTGTAAVGTVIAADLVAGDEAVLASTLVVTVLLTVFGEVAPKTVALHHSEAIVRAYAWPLAQWSRLMQPVVSVLDRVNRALLLIIGGRAEAAAALSLGEVRTAILLGAESGALHRDASAMALGALTLRHRQVRTIMTRRPNMVLADADDLLDTVAQRLAEAGYLRLPVYSGSPENLVGYVHVSDVAAAFAAGRTHQRARDIMRAIAFETERASLARVLEHMQESATHLVILVDEFGVVSGLVTLEDVLEEVVGEIHSESGQERTEVAVRIGGRRFVEGQRQLADLSEELGVNLTHPEAESVGGLILAYLRRYPQRGEYIEHAGYRFTVMAADERRITLVAVEPAHEATRPEAES